MLSLIQNQKDFVHLHSASIFQKERSASESEKSHCALEVVVSIPIIGTRHEDNGRYSFMVINIKYNFGIRLDSGPIPKFVGSSLRFHQYDLQRPD